MKKIRKFFKPVTAHRNSEVILDGYQSLETKELRELSRSALIEIIYRYDNDIVHLNQEIKTYKDRIDKLKEELTITEIQPLSFTKNHIPQLDQNNELVNSKSEDNESKIKELDDLLDTYKHVFSQANDQISPSEINFSYIKHSILESKKLSKEINNTRKTYKVLTNENAELKEKVDILKEEIEILTNDKLSLQGVLKEKDIKIGKIIHKETARNEAFVKLQETIDNNKKIIQSGQKKIEQITLENYDLLDKNQEILKELDIANDKLAKTIKSKEELRIELKNYKFTNKGQEINHGTLFSIKLSLEKLYKNLLFEMSKNIDGDSSFYSLTSEDFTSIERRFNNIIMQVQESLGTPREKHSRRSSTIVPTHLLDCVSPKSAKQISKKQRLQVLKRRV